MKEVIETLEQQIKHLEKWKNHTQDIIDVIDFRHEPKKIARLISKFESRIAKYEEAINILNGETVKQEKVCPFCSMNGDDPSFCQC